MNKQKFYTTIILMLMFFSGYAETTTTSSYKSIITVIYLQAVTVGAIVSIITIGLVSINAYELIDKNGDINDINNINSYGGYSLKNFNDFLSFYNNSQTSHWVDFFIEYSGLGGQIGINWSNL